MYPGVTQRSRGGELQRRYPHVEEKCPDSYDAVSSQSDNEDDEVEYMIPDR